jgi:23S rRNA (adenine2030-N6)-methyltransferase
MFSYRHAFHAGNHADVIKHLTLIATLQHLQQKEGGITIVDTHAGAGLYRLDGDYSETGGEATDGIFKLLSQLDEAAAKKDAKPIPDALQAYLDMIASFNPNGQAKFYPGSPFILHAMLRKDARDKLRLFELHPTDSKALASNVAQLDAGRSIMIAREDGFESLKKMLPPPPSATGSKRAMVLIDPSYEIKSDYSKVASVIQEYLKRFSTGTYLVWYPIVRRSAAAQLPARLTRLARAAPKGWLHASLTVGEPDEEGFGMSGSGVVVINPPHTLRAALADALPWLAQSMARGPRSRFTLEDDSSPPRAVPSWRAPGSVRPTLPARAPHVRSRTPR